MTYEEILQRLEGYRSAIAAEDRLVRTGLKTRPALSAVRDEHAEVFSEASLITVREIIERAPQARKREQSERALFALLEGRTRPTFECSTRADDGFVASCATRWNTRDDICVVARADALDETVVATVGHECTTDIVAERERWFQ